jgi:uncharacterized protein
MVIVFTRAPLAGRVKTRLAARLGAAGAARLHQRLTVLALRTALAAGCGPVELHATSRHTWLLHLAKRHNVALRLQRGRDLGERMARATRAALRRAPFVVLTGSDCPQIAPRDLARARRSLVGGADVVLAPAHDGGYALIALARPAEFLFRDIPWGGDRVYAETLERLERAGWRMRALPPVADIDRPEDLERIRWLSRNASSSASLGRRGRRAKPA